jgi:probable O-glycosylation ligase (exosortase A-associated)
MTAEPTPQATTSDKPAISELVDTGSLFALYLVVNAIEYAGLSSIFPILKVTRLSTLLAWLLAIIIVKKVGFKELKEHRQSRLLLLLAFWTGMSGFWAVVGSYVPTTFRYTMDYLGLMVVTMYLVDRPSRLKSTAVMFSLVLIFVVIRNADLLNSGTRLVRFRGAYFMGDGNDLSWAFATLLVFPAYLAVGRHGFLLRILGLLSGGFALAAIVLTQSRGATLALGAIAIYYWTSVSRRKVVTLAAVAVVVLGVIAFAPAGYLDRMNSIQNYEEDNSAQGRIRAWKASVKMAVDYPLGVGGGNFPSAYGRYYRDPNAEGWGAARWMNAHSVYFKVLGEYGFGGLALLLVVIFSNFFDNQRALRSVRADPSRYPIGEAWPAAVNMGLVGFSIAAIFLGGVTYPHLFLVTGLTLGTRRMMEVATARVAAPTAKDSQDALPGNAVERWAVLSARNSTALQRPGGVRLPSMR